MLTLNINSQGKTYDLRAHLSSLTIPQIKDWAKANNYRVPSGLKKADIINYLTGIEHEKTSGIVKEQKTSIGKIDSLHPCYANDSMPWLLHLHKYGWAVAPIEGWDSKFTDMFLSWFEDCSPNGNKSGEYTAFDRRNRETWKTKNMPVMLHGILKNYFGHTELQWKIRELCAPIFARIWNCNPEDLLCSFDGGCFMPSVPKDNLKKSSFKQWIHNDSPRDFTMFSCVQGIVNFEDNGPEDGGLVLVEGSHEVFSEYINRHPSEGITWGTSDMDDPLLANRRLIKICAPKGSIIMFDSRVFHNNVHPYGSILKEDGTYRFRMCTYVSMQPRMGATEKELAKRVALYEKGRMTGHWCYGPWFKETAENPRSYGKDIIRPTVIEIAPLNPMRRRLIGY